jgi:3-deoxy-D-manno-octulosonic acid (KDO) 8-phosphate synthase
MSNRLFFLILLSFVLCLTMAQAQDVKKTKVFLLAGQSNMDGRGAAEKLTIDERKQLAFAQKRIHFYYKGMVNNGNDPLIVDGPLDVTDPWPFVK